MIPILVLADDELSEFFPWQIELTYPLAAEPGGNQEKL
jgi:hypothetical protein